MEDNTKYFIGFVAVVLLIAIVMQMQKSRAAKQDGLGELNNFIDTGTGGIGNNTVTNAVANVAVDTSYRGAEADARTIKSAGCYAVVYCFTPSNDRTVIQVLQGKTAGQLAAIEAAFNRLYGRTLDDWIVSNFYATGQRNIYAVINQIRTRG